MTALAPLSVSLSLFFSDQGGKQQPWALQPAPPLSLPLHPNDLSRSTAGRQPHSPMYVLVVMMMNSIGPPPPSSSSFPHTNPPPLHHRPGRGVTE